MPDWRALPVPLLLWVNTAALVAASVGLQCAQVAARRGDLADGAAPACWPAASASLVFLAGQVVGLAAAAHAGLFPGQQPGQLLLLS